MFCKWYKKCYGYSRTGFPEYIGNCIQECCVCQCWEKWFYLNIYTDEMENVYELVKYMYNGILEVEMKTYSTNGYTTLFVATSMTETRISPRE